MVQDCCCGKYATNSLCCQWCRSIKNARLKIQEQIKAEANYKATVESIEAEKKKTIKGHIGFENNTGFTDKKEIEKTDAFAKWKKQVNEQYNNQIAELKERLEERYAQMRKTIVDYPIFMAIAEQIGYDATGKPTSTNELETIGTELKKFIETL